MHIGFDGKRIFQNQTGLGNYARSLVQGLATQYPQHQYSLFAPKQTAMFDAEKYSNITIQLPATFIDKKLPGLWRRSRMVKDIAAAKLTIFHGLSNELPAGIEKIKVKSVITVHDLIFERYPETYHWDQRYTHRWKMKKSCQVANAVIAASIQTKKDLQQYYQIPADKIFVCYQNCNPLFQQLITEKEKLHIKIKYNLPDQFFLFVSSITQRKNLITACRALLLLKDSVSIPLVVIGDGKKDKALVKDFINSNGLQQRVIFLNELPVANEAGFAQSLDFPAIYQQAFALIYPSFFEGFGIPLLEAMWSGLPVISSNASCLPEVGGDAVLYFSPDDAAALSHQMQQLIANPALHQSLKEKGFIQAAHFTAANHAEAVMNVYKALV
jgi:glycosyltransferase involved in cell wall biosynthesis